MKVWITQYLDCMNDVTFLCFDRIFDTKEKAKEYCEEKNEEWDYHYTYEECEVE